jgi:ABC-type dipeptide/oligopeptide/nickel transport system permease subunit
MANPIGREGIATTAIVTITGMTTGMTAGMTTGTTVDTATTEDCRL